jgi:hypothetical protein
LNNKAGIRRAECMGNPERCKELKKFRGARQDEQNEFFVVYARRPTEREF